MSAPASLGTRPGALITPPLLDVPTMALRSFVLPVTFTWNDLPEIWLS